jgi:hypothetical protein
LPTEQLRLPARLTTNNKPGSNLRLINRLRIPLSAVIPNAPACGYYKKN